MPESSGGRLASRYLLRRPLGSGGMGTVWLAWDEMLERQVAVKELRLPDGLDEAQRAEAVERAVREARAAAQVRHPGIVALHDVLVHDGRPWIIMELLRGRTLADEVKDRGPLPPDRAAWLGAQVLDALREAHAHGVQHRDVKPANVFLSDDGRAVLTDFGIAKLDGHATLTAADATIGSPGFIAPERLDGAAGGPASDLWSLGATLYLATEGGPAYGGSPVERLQATLTSRVPPPPRRAGTLGPLVTWMMDRDPAARPDTATAQRLLTDVAEGRSPAPYAPVSPGPHAQPGFPDVRNASTAPGRQAGPAAPAGHAGATGRSWADRRGWILGGAGVAVAAAAALVVTLVVIPGDAEAGPPSFTLPVDFCSLLTGDQVHQLIRTAPAPKGRASGAGCEWTVSGEGVSLIPKKDSDTPDPWAMTEESSRLLFESLAKKYAKGQKGDWTWKEIGQTRPITFTQTTPRTVDGVGDEALAYEFATRQGHAYAGVVLFRVGDLVVEAAYATLSTTPTDDDIRSATLTAARMADAALRAKG
ncbi:serine/threonine protein kinase [Microtetraspora sp. AC03309]|uniref:serine/threonine-protein kinase n=1 Tax=Microtetraspora sp. AC03309 TaxID=2779376 RepID=UPI001E398006|nr:serine/threonine-protein kinase [Microtetraspora sp. AC03309]MCC5577603.1 serine/threonine protein kinase [Microtetraspora sp. AC03309]